MWMGALTNIAAITALNAANYEDGIVFWAIAEKKWISLDKTSTATTNSVTCWTATGGGRWLLSSDAIAISTAQPTGGAAVGTRWIWQEDGAVNDYDSVITYIYNGTTWIEIDTRMRLHTDTPDSLSKTPNSEREQWNDTSTGTLYHAFNGGWVVGGGAS